MPHIDQPAFIAQGAIVTGDAALDPGCSVWYNAVIRADEAPITIGENTNIQDCAVIHVSPDHPVSLGTGVTVGHGAIVHGCTVGDNTLIGMGSILLDGSVVGSNCIIGAGALVTQGTCIPDGSLAFGSPARVVRQITQQEMASNAGTALEYIELARRAREERDGQA